MTTIQECHPKKKSDRSHAASPHIDLTTASTHSQDNSDAEEMDNNNFYGREYDNTNEDFSYHSSDGSDKDDAGYDCSLGNGMEGMSPPATAYSRDGQFPLGGQVEDLPDWLHEMDTNQIYDASHLLAAPITQVFPCVACNDYSNINNPTSWIPVFLRKSGKTTWEVFDKNCGEVGPELEWDGNEGLKHFWGVYYRCPDSAYIQCFQAARTAKNPSLPSATLLHAIASPLDKVFDGGLAKDDAAATSTTCSSTSPGSVLVYPVLSGAKDTAMPDARPPFSLGKCNDDLQAALNKHRDDVLCLLRTGTATCKNAIPQKMLLKIRGVNMTTMVQINDLIARAGGKKLSKLRLNELGRNAERKARVIYKAEEDDKNTMDQTYCPIHIYEMNSDFQSPVRVPQSPEEFLLSLLPDEFRIMIMEPDGNCLSHSISDQLNQDNGSAHGFMRHQITNHVRRHGNEFKDFLLLQDDHEDVSDLDSYIHKMGQNGIWGGNPEVYAAAWFYGVNIKIYSQYYVNTDGVLIIKADGPQGTNDHSCVMWNFSYHGNNHFNSIRSPRNPSCPTQHIMNIEHYQAYLQQILDDYQDDFAIMASLTHTGSTPIPPHEINLIRETTALIMPYIALQLLGAGGEAVLEPRLKILRDQAKEGAMEFIQTESAQTAQGPSQPDAPSTTHSALLHYKVELQAAINSYCNNIFQLLMLSPTSNPRPDLSIRYDKLRGISSPIISGLAHLITHLGGKEMSNHEIDSVT